MLVSRSVKPAYLAYLLLAVAAATVLVSGAARAEAAPGKAESESSSTVEVNSNDNSSVTVTSTNESTTTAGGSSDGQSQTPSITQQSSQTFVNNYNSSTETSPPTDQSGQVEQSSQTGDAVQITPSANDQTETPATGNAGTPALKETGNNYTTPVPSQQDPAKLPAPVKSEPEKSAPVPVNSSGAVNQAAGGGFGAGGKGSLAGILSLGGLPVTRIQIVFLAMLFITASCFIAYLRRSGFSHAPRSDDSVASFLSSFATPRVEMSWVRASSPVPSSFFVASETKQLMGRKGGEWM